MKNQTIIDSLFFTSFAALVLSNRLGWFIQTYILSSFGQFRLLSLYAGIESLLLMIFTTYGGVWLDKNSRIYGAKILLLLIGIFSVLSCISINAAFKLNKTSLLKNDDITNECYYCLLISTLTTPLSSFFYNLLRMSLTKDWIFVLAEASSERGTENHASIDMFQRNDKKLTYYNTISGLIYQISFIVEPIITGFFINYFNYQSASTIFCIFSVIIWIGITFALNYIFKNVNELKKDGNAKRLEEIVKMLPQSSNGEEIKKESTLKLIKFLRHKIAFVALALSLTYMNVLQFSGISIAYAVANKIPDSTINIYRSIGSLLALGGTASYPLFNKYFGLIKTGLIGFTLQQLFLWLCLISIFLPGSIFTYNPFKFQFTESNISILIFLVGITLSRFGLYLADSSVNQQMQHMIEEENRSEIFGMHTSISYTLTLISSFIVFLFPNPMYFGFFVMSSIIELIVGYIFYIKHIQTIN
uniref:Solute carrier family 40 member n=1 Tax=Parastrongyloides trichosuri TaxID=131310 RepID=A0A0N5A2X1_PARTI